jgi:hypothetical protein
MNTFARILAFAITVALGAAMLVYVLRAEPADLTGLVVAMTGGAFASVAVLGYYATRRPPIGALTERAFVGFVIALLGLVACILTYNTDTGRSLFPPEVASMMFRLAVLAVLAVPNVWLVLWLLNRLGASGRG